MKTKTNTSLFMTAFLDKSQTLNIRTCHYVLLVIGPQQHIYLAIGLVSARTCLSSLLSKKIVFVITAFYLKKLYSGI